LAFNSKESLLFPSHKVLIFLETCIGPAWRPQHWVA